VKHDLGPASRSRELHLLTVATVLRPERLNQQRLDVTDGPPRVSKETLRNLAKLPASVREAPSENSAEAEPREPVPLLGVMIARMASEPVSYRLIASQADVVGAVVVVENVDAALVSEVAGGERAPILTDAPEEPKASGVAAPWCPQHFVGTPEESVAADESPT